MAKSRIAHKLDEAGADHRALESKRPEWAPPRGVTVGAAYDPAEHQADALAARVLRKLSTGDGPTAAAAPAHAEGQCDDAVHRAASGGQQAGEFEADPKTSADLRGRSGKGKSLEGPLRGQLEQGFGRSLAGVKVHTDATAGRLADSFNAEAFTHGKDVFFGRDRFDPQSESGRSLLVHELAHVVQGGAQPPVRRKLKGTVAAVEEGKGKAGAGEKLFKTDYGKIVTKLKEFEKREDKVLAQKNFGRLGNDRFWMEKTLRDIIKLIDAWLVENDTMADAGARQKRNAELFGDMGNEYEDALENNYDAKRERMEREVRGGRKSQRARTLSMLRPRLFAELQDIADPVSYFQGKQLNDATLDRASDFTKDDAVGGGVNRLDQVQHQGGKKGYFIADKSNLLKSPMWAGTTQIDMVDPQMGARSVASSRLAKLFGANEVVDIQFATHSSKTHVKGKPLAESLTKMGVVSEQAAGSSAGDLKLARNAKERQDMEGKSGSSKVVDMQDPELQRGLNVLQMLDYLSLQMDRHVGNYYIATDDKGKVLGVKGIDLDVSFGKFGKDGKVDSQLRNGHFVGVPQLADAKFREKVLRVTPDEITKCLHGLISPPEINATIERLTYLQKVLREMDPKKIVQEGGWNKETAQEQLGKDNYLQKLNVGTMAEEFSDQTFDILQTVNANERTTIRDHVKAAVETGTLTYGQGRAVVKTLVNSFSTSAYWDRVRTAKKGAEDVRGEADRTYSTLLDEKKTGGGGGANQVQDIDEKIMAADLARQEKAELAKAAKKEYDDAVEMFVKNIVDYAVQRATRQRPRTSQRRPSLGQHRMSTGANV